MKHQRFFTLYQYLGPLLLTPLAFWLWWNSYGGNIALVMVAWLVPILFAYIVPGIGTNLLRVWEFNTRYKLGRFRPQHGFVFGSATSSMAWLCHMEMATDLFGVMQTAFVLASVLGFWNLIYDIKALKAGILLVYNQPWAEHQGEEAIAMDYAPIFFAGFGMVYGFGIGMAELMALHGMMSTAEAAGLFAAVLAGSIAVPVLLYRHSSFRKHGHSGCRPIAEVTETEV